MGFLSKLFYQVEDHSNDTVQSGFVGLCVAAAGADGHINDAEWTTIVGYISRINIFNEVKNTEINKFFDKAIATLNSKDSEALLAQAASLIPEELANTAFACICDILLSDGNLETEERTILEKAYTLLNIDESVATTIMEVMLIKNKM